MTVFLIQACLNKISLLSLFICFSLLFGTVCWCAEPVLLDMLGKLSPIRLYLPP